MFTSEVSLIAVLVAAIVHMIVGMIWFSPGAFGKAWMKEIGMSASDMKKAKESGMGKTMFLGFLAGLVTAYVFSHVMGMAAVTEWQGAVEAAFWTWLGFIAMTMLGGVLWGKQSVKLFVITSGYWLVSLAAMGIVLVYWVS
jgi:hypothetical protein